MDNQSGLSSSRIVNSSIGNSAVYRNAVVKDSSLGDGCSIGDDTTIVRCHFENNVLINRRSYINDSNIGRYTYAGINTTINVSSIGRYCSIARNVDIGGFDHDYSKITTMPAFRFLQNTAGADVATATNEFGTTKCHIGNDAWIAAGAIILHKATIGDGAIVGAGAVVTHDVPPYAIVAGVPAKVVGYRCKPDLVERLLNLQWWNWPESVLLEIFPDIINTEICDESITRLENIKMDSI